MPRPHSRRLYNLSRLGGGHAVKYRGKLSVSIDQYIREIGEEMVSEAVGDFNIEMCCMLDTYKCTHTHSRIRSREIRQSIIY